MREIKFRGRKANLPRGFIYGYFAIIKGMNYIINEEGKHLIIAGTARQYTGLKDKNGKEIYEGDIIRHYDAIEIERGNNGELFSAVYWSEKSGWWSLEDRNQNFVDGLNRAELPEVIGNIHENPELFKKPDK